MDKECVQCLLNVILDREDLTVTSVETQPVMEVFTGHSLTLDVVAVDECNALYDFDKLPESYVIFITEEDVLKGNQSVYRIDRMILGLDRPFGDGSHIIYVNGKYSGDDKVGKLIHDLKCTEPDEIFYSELANRVKLFKESEEGVKIMSSVFETIRLEGLEKGREEGREKGLEEGREEGRDEALRNTVYELYDMGMPMDKIAKAVRKDIKTVEEWLSLTKV
ncbi:MAG: hypothetical protein LUE96_09055 [Lachnospiraceae bacterium]|nr:hypothetical protein [Lachnospiraceae bacterium]